MFPSHDIIAERVASLEAKVEHTKDAVDRIDRTVTEVFTKISHVSNQVASLNTEIKSDKAADEAKLETDHKWRTRLYVACSGVFSGISVAVTDHFDLLSKLLNIFK